MMNKSMWNRRELRNFCKQYIYDKLELDQRAKECTALSEVFPKVNMYNLYYCFVDFIGSNEDNFEDDPNFIPHQYIYNKSFIRFEELWTKPERRAEVDRIIKQLRSERTLHRLPDNQLDMLRVKPLYILSIYLPVDRKTRMPNNYFVEIIGDPFVCEMLTDVYTSDATWFMYDGDKIHHTFHPRWMQLLGAEGVLCLRYLCLYETYLYEMGAGPRGGWFELNLYNCFLSQGLLIDDFVRVRDILEDNRLAFVYNHPKTNTWWCRLNHYKINSIYFMHLKSKHIFAVSDIVENLERVDPKAYLAAQCVWCAFKVQEVCNGILQPKHSKSVNFLIDIDERLRHASELLLSNWRHKNVYKYLKKRDEIFHRRSEGEFDQYEVPVVI